MTMKGDLHLEGLEVTDYCGTTQNIGGQVAEEDGLQWIEEDGDPGYHTMTENEIADEVMTWEDEGRSEDKEEDRTTCPKQSYQCLDLISTI